MSRITGFRSTQVLLPEGVKPATILVQNGFITGIQDYDYYQTPSFTPPIEVMDCGSHLVMAGLIDSHVHINEPGRTDWEGFETATRAAAAGGVTTLVDMPLNSLPPTTTVANLGVKRTAAKNQCSVDVGFWGGLIPGNQDDLLPLLDAGVPGFKCFLIHSGVEEFPHVTEPYLRQAMTQLQGTDAVLLFHAEMDCACAGSTVTLSPPQSFETFLQSRPPQMETEAIALVCKLCLEFNVKCHIVHLSAAGALPLIRQAKEAGAPLTVETCFHYLVLEAETVPDGATQFKCCPPIRDHENRELLWQGIKDGTIDMVVSDHSPCTPALKRPESGDFMQAWGGIASLQLGLSLLWTEGQPRGLTFRDLERLLSLQPARLAQLIAKGKGCGIQLGQQADLVIWSPDQEFKVVQEDLLYKNKISPYLGRTLRGTVEQTVLRGQVVFSRKSGFSSSPLGRLIPLQDN